MKKTLARLREAGSFIAGLLIGLSIMVAVFAMIVVNPSDWQMWSIFGAPIILAAGVTLQVVVTSKHRREPPTRPEPTASPVGFIQLIHER